MTRRAECSAGMHVGGEMVWDVCVGGHASMCDCVVFALVHECSHVCDACRLACVSVCLLCLPFVCM